NQAIFGDQFPTVGQRKTYVTGPNDNWLAGFWTGLLWLTYATTRDETTRNYAAARLASFEKRLDDRVRITHDLGFLYTLSARAQWQLTGDDHARAVALRAADELAQRYRPAGKYIQAWDAIGDPTNGGRIIVDTMMNLHLLFWASAQTGDMTYHNIARQHANSSAAYLVRDDYSTNHTFFFDQATGKPIGPQTHQGYSDDSLWARGQAWAIFGFATAAEWCPERRAHYLALSERLMQRWQTELSPDGVPLWDFRLPDDAPHYPDTSAGAIAASGMLRLAKQLAPDKAQQVRETATQLLQAMIDHDLETEPDAQGLLRGGTYHAHKQWGVDEYFICGDYFFLEALLMLKGNCPDFWGTGNH
ncbi:MAG: glycoside hydrolase family 88 protein, partial [Anaerolineae bacterium]|nr:glycoside hydrolase family 88 protein [Anaerolineae bacterium]